MDNARIAEVLSEIAVLLEIKGENRFKSRSYERAAEAVANLSQGAAQVRAEKGGLQALPGVGKSIAEKIEELLDTGKCSYHEELLAEIPATVFDMLRIPGLGPKKVKLLTQDDMAEAGAVSDDDPADLAERKVGLEQLAEACERLSDGQREV
ncbi:MAG: hypothetical protein MUQ65_13160, partial [Armatimonadetes bacterium]|nr:hypothetical protein [Armatimonadota bacterium]